MSSLRWVAGAVLGVLVLFGVGCQDWQVQAEQCSLELEDLRANFDATQDALMQCESMNDQLRAELDQCRQDLNAGGRTPQFSGEQAAWDPSRGTLTVTIASDVLFASGSATLQPQARTRLQNIVNVLKRDYAAKDVSVVGHTDRHPIRISGWDDNWELSCQRALSVVRYLASQGIEARRLAAVGRGEFHLRSTDDQSRRVEIVVHMYSSQ